MGNTRYFASDYLKSISGTPDWICVYDLCATCHHTYWQVDLTADWSPSRGVVVFGNSWDGVPDMPAPEIPTEEAVEAWVDQHPDANEYLRHLAARRRVRQEFDDRMEALDRKLKREGPNYCLLAWGPYPWTVSVMCVNLAGPMQVLRNIRPEIKQQGIRRLRVGKLNHINAQLARLRHGRKVFLKNVDEAVTLLEHAAANLTEINRRKLSGKAPACFKLPADAIREAIRTYRLQLDCPVNSDDHCRIPLMSFLQNSLMDVVIKYLDKVDWNMPGQTAVWWEDGTGPADENGRYPVHRDIVALASRACDHILKLRREGRLDEQPASSPKPRPSKRSKKGSRKEKT